MKLKKNMTGSKTYGLVGITEDGAEEWLERFDLNVKRSEIEKKSKKHQKAYAKGFVYLLDGEDKPVRVQYYLWGYHNE